MGQVALMRDGDTHRGFWWGSWRKGTIWKTRR